MLQFELGKSYSMYTDQIGMVTALRVENMHFSTSLTFSVAVFSAIV